MAAKDLNQSRSTITSLCHNDVSDHNIEEKFKGVGLQTRVHSGASDRTVTHRDETDVRDDNGEGIIEEC